MSILFLSPHLPLKKIVPKIDSLERIRAKSPPKPFLTDTATDTAIFCSKKKAKTPQQKGKRSGGPTIPQTPRFSAA